MIAELGRELTARGVPRRRRERILAEIADHLDCDPDADLGEPRALAARPALIGAVAAVAMLVVTWKAERSFAEGAERAAVEAIAFTAGFLALGRYLGLRRKWARS